MSVPAAVPAGLVALTKYTPPSAGNCTGSRVSVEVTGGVAVLVFVIDSLSFASVAGVPSMNHVMSVRGRLNCVMITVKTSRVPVDTSMSLRAVEMTGATVQSHKY